MRFVLFVEGETESKVLPAFFKRWLDPRLPTPVGIKTVKFQGWSHLCQGVTKKLEDMVGHSRFRHYFAVHELEAWLLSDPQIFPKPVSKVIPSREPELINMQQPPKALLRNLYRIKTKSTYKEIIHGTDLFGRLDPNLAYQRCPHLRWMLDDMLDLAVKVS